VIDLRAIARRYGGNVANGTVLIPTPGHSIRDRGTAITVCADAPDGLLVHCFNGDRVDALAVKEMLREDGFVQKSRARAPARLLSTRSERTSLMRKDAAKESEKRKAQGIASKHAAATWSAAKCANPHHGYLVSKGLSPFGVRQSGAALLVPMFDQTFALRNVQRIFPDGSKRFLPRAQTLGLFWPHAMHFANGNPSSGPLVIGEGFATMGAIYEATGYAVAAAMSACNLEPVARAMRGLFPARQIVIAADNDSHLTENTGLRVAQKAARSIGGLLAVPQSKSTFRAPGIDFADLMRDEAAAIIAATLSGEAAPWST
jgi:phage/plasmid primase-like uncharacterized protein